MELPVKYDTLNRRQKRLVKELYIEQQKGLSLLWHEERNYSYP